MIYNKGGGGGGACDIIYSQDVDVLKPCTFGLGSFKNDKKGKRCFIISIFLLALTIFSQRCFSNNKIGSRIRPKCLCSFTLATWAQLKVNLG